MLAKSIEQEPTLATGLLLPEDFSHQPFELFGISLFELSQLAERGLFRASRLFRPGFRAFLLHARI